MKMDFSNLTPVTKANPTGQSFDFKWSKGKEEFRFSDKLFASMQLEYNSLQQFDHPEMGTLLGVCPGNTGVFYKKIKGKAKGKRFKNAVLSKACEEAGLSTDLTLVHEGTNGEIEMYSIRNRAGQQTELVEDDVQDDNPFLEEEPQVESNVESVKDEF